MQGLNWVGSAGTGELPTLRYRSNFYGSPGLCFTRLVPLLALEVGVALEGLLQDGGLRVTEDFPRSPAHGRGSATVPLPSCGHSGAAKVGAPPIPCHLSGSSRLRQSVRDGMRDDGQSLRSSTQVCLRTMTYGPGRWALGRIDYRRVAWERPRRAKPDFDFCIHRTVEVLRPPLNQ